MIVSLHRAPRPRAATGITARIQQHRKSVGTWMTLAKFRMRRRRRWRHKRFKRSRLAYPDPRQELRILRGGRSDIVRAVSGMEAPYWPIAWDTKRLNPPLDNTLRVVAHRICVYGPGTKLGPFCLVHPPLTEQKQLRRSICVAGLVTLPAFWGRGAPVCLPPNTPAGAPSPSGVCSSLNS
jgi:hypothetical protein